MIISIVSGKGGTGKTTVAVNLALSLKNVQFLDCDVEEPNAHIFLKPVIEEKKSAFVPVPEINEEECDYCGKCREVCAYNAIAVFKRDEDKKSSILIFHHLCHGCGGCSLICPQNAIKEVNREIGIIENGYTNGLQFIHGKLNISEIMSPALIRQVKGYINPTKTVIIDAPPGTSCPVIASVKDSNFCVLVTEPTPFGMNDLILAIELLKKMNMRFGVIINRSDIGNNEVEKYCQHENIPVLMYIPFDRRVAELYSKGIPVVELQPERKYEFRNLFNKITQLLYN